MGVIYSIYIPHEAEGGVEYLTTLQQVFLGTRVEITNLWKY